MALQSPGVQVTVIDESFYTPAEPGTTPLIVVATAEDKKNATGTAIAVGTAKSNAGKAFRMTSQRDIIDFFGVPFFEKTATGIPVHGGERNEYGLLTAYSLLGVTNSAFIVRADIDLNQIAPQAGVPGSQPDDGRWWVETASTAWGIKEWNGAARSVGGQRFINKTPIVLTDDDVIKISSAGTPNESVGSIGDYAVVYQASKPDPIAKIYYKSPGGPVDTVNPGEWVLLGSDEWSWSWPAVISKFVDATTTVGTLNSSDEFFINGTLIQNFGTTLNSLVSAINSSATPSGVKARNIGEKLYLYTDGDVSSADSTTSDAIVIGEGTGSILTDIGIPAGTYYGPKLQQTPHTQVPEWKISDTATRPTGSVWINTTEPNGGARWRVRKYSAILQAFELVDAPIYAFTHESLFFLDRSGGGINLPLNSLFVQSNSREDRGITDTKLGTATFKIWRRASTGPTTIKTVALPSNTFSINVTNSYRIWESLRGQRNLSAGRIVTFVSQGTSADANTLAGAINAAGFTHIEAAITENGELEIVHKTGGDIRFSNIEGLEINSLFTPDVTPNFYTLPELAVGQFISSNWQPLAATGFAAQRTAPINQPLDGQLWYNPEVNQVDIMVHNGEIWVGYRSAFPLTDPEGPFVSATAPEKQRDGSTPLQEGELWISTADLENYPLVYRWNDLDKSWDRVDTTDQVTEEGIVFADARYGASGALGNTAASIKDLLTNNFVDPDTPDPALYPKGILLWNTRRSSGNVKKFVKNYIPNLGIDDNLRFDSTFSPNGTFNSGESMSAYAPDRWVTASSNNEDGSGSFGRKAQRKVVTQAMKSVVDTSLEIRDTERRNFNLIAAPAYPELYSNLINLNLDRGITSFVVADSPLRLKDDATSLIDWGTNAKLVLDNGDDGIVSFDEYSAVYYPNGFTTDLTGSNAVVPASHMMLRTITLSDQASYPWFAPAGTRRGGITNATAVGYIDSLTGEFQTVALNEGTRDVLYDLKVNPIPFFVGVGLVAYGQKTRARNASALDRINVARLVVYLRSQLNKLARPYIFEPNDKLTRDEVKQAVESLLLELVGLRAIFDFAVVCDESNNTPSRVDRNELWVDIAIEPVKAVEFIYIPLRVKNTGEI